MSTRCRIGIEGKDAIGSLYCHSDGYPEHTGVYLVKYYNTDKKVEQLFKLGDLSYIGKGYTEELSRYSWNSPYQDDNIMYEISRDVTRAYKDRGEEKIGVAIAENRKQFVEFTKECWGEYAYLYAYNKQGKRAWFYYDINANKKYSDSKWVELTEYYVDKIELEQYARILKKNIEFLKRKDIQDSVVKILEEE